MRKIFVQLLRHVRRKPVRFHGRALYDGSRTGLRASMRLQNCDSLVNVKRYCNRFVAPSGISCAEGD